MAHIKGARCAVFLLTLSLLGSVLVGCEGTKPTHDVPDIFYQAQHEKSFVEPQLGVTLPNGARFQNAQGKRFTLGEIVGEGKPMLLTFNYSSCPGLCNEQLSYLAEAIKAIRPKAELGKDYLAVSISMAPDEDLAKLASGHETYSMLAGHKEANPGWYFLMSRGDDAKVVADTVGYHYDKFTSDEGLVEYNHPPTTMFVSPEGVVTQYYFTYPYEDLIQEMDPDNPATLDGPVTYDGLVDGIQRAQEGRVLSAADQAKVMTSGLNCLIPISPKSLPYLQITKGVGIGIIVLLGGFLGFLWLRDVGRRSSDEPST